MGGAGVSEEEEAATTGVAAASERLKDAKGALSLAVKDVLQQLEPKLSADGELRDTVQTAFESLHRRALDQLTSLSESDASALRKQLKDQAKSFESKLHSARKASNVAMENRQAALEAAHVKAMEAKVHELTGGNDNALLKAKRQLDEAAQEIEEASTCLLEPIVSHAARHLFCALADSSVRTCGAAQEQEQHHRGKAQDGATEPHGE
jgi:leucyl-tRNA synthetase